VSKFVDFFHRVDAWMGTAPVSLIFLIALIFMGVFVALTAIIGFTTR
jgi:hypothetical protein